ncbi:MAG: hypothetical protein AVDCRST_MAG95-45, partial [uncultured Adhaeribacter sp.]
PTQPVTGVELIGVLPIAAEFRFSTGMQPNLVAVDRYYFEKTRLQTQSPQLL